jgi:alanyl-tRNA synthetase
MTERLYYNDSYLTSFQARVVESLDSGLRVVLDRTAFYPASGGQPHDLGHLNGIAVLEVIDDQDRIIHVLAAPLNTAEIAGAVQWDRRHDHMQQHSGQHLLSAVFDQLLHARTLSFHLGADSSTIDLDSPSLTPAQLQSAERRANQLIQQNLPLAVSFQDASEAAGLRKESTREGTLRIVSIGGLDRSACGGTHVRSTGEIGPLLLRKTEKIRNSTRVEFLCGLRAIARARADFDALSQIARQFSAPLDETPALVTAQLDQARDAAKSRLKLAIELNTLRGRALYSETPPDPAGRRRHIENRAQGPLDDELRTLAQSFCAQPSSVFLATSENPPSALLAVSADSGLHAGIILKEALIAAGGRGGGSAQLAQGSLPAKDAIPTLLAHIAL